MATVLPFLSLLAVLAEAAGQKPEGQSFCPRTKSDEPGDEGLDLVAVEEAGDVRRRNPVSF
jgi:hypothetical protein